MCFFCRVPKLIASLEQDIMAQFHTIKEENKTMSAAIDALTAAVKDAEAQEAAAIAVIQQETAKIADLVAQLAAASEADPQIQALADELAKSNEALKAAFPTS